MGSVQLNPRLYMLFKFCNLYICPMLRYSLVFCAITLFFTACGKKETSTGGSAAPVRANYAVQAVEGYVVKASQLTETVTAGGTLLPSESTELRPEATGRVVKINLPEGKAVRKNELLLKIFDDDLQTQLRKLQTQLSQAEITEQRLSDLLKVKGVSQQEYDLAALQVQTLKSEMELVQINIRKTELRAPYDGVIGLRQISPGAYVSPANVVATLRALNTLKLDFSVPEKYSSLLHAGQKVEFTLQGGAKTYTATVIATEQSINADTRNLQVRALVKDVNRELLPGAFAEVKLALGSNARALMIPSQAIIPMARDKKVIVSKNGVANFVTVKTGVRQTEMVEVTEGLSAGDTIATTGILFLRPQSPVKFAKVN